MRKHTKTLVGLSLLATILTLSLTILFPHRALAAAPLSQAQIEQGSFSFTDRAHIKAVIGGVTYSYLDKDINDTQFQYALENVGDGCSGVIEFPSPGLQGVDGSMALDNIIKNGKLQPSVVQIQYRQGGVGSCRGTSPGNLMDRSTKIQVSSSGINIWYQWSDATTIGRVDGNGGWTFSQTQDPKQSKQLFIRTTGGGCGNFIVVSTDHKSMKIYRMEDNKQNGRDGLSDVPEPDHTILAPVFPNNCELWGTIVQDLNRVTYSGNVIRAPSYPLGSIANQQKPSGSGGPTDTSGNGTGAQISCEVTISPISWIICPLVAAANDAAVQLDNAITNRLTINTTRIFDTSLGKNCSSTSSKGQECTAQAFYAAWNTFRIIAVSLLVVIGLVMIIAQAFAVGPFDAYTVKKVLPRLLIAIIFMSISWYIMKFMIDVTNDLGIGVRAAIEAPFKGLGRPTFNTAAISASGILGAGALILLGPLGLLSFAVTGLMAVLIAFFVIAIREMAIMFLVIIAPLGIAAYILPNTQKAWKLWWESFSKGLMMFPIIMGFIAIGRVFAAVTSTADQGLLSQMIMFIAYFGPYFALPFAFKLAGGTIANLAGIVNDRSRGIFDRTKKFRQGQVAQRGAQMKAGNLYEGRSYIPGSRAVARGFNRTTVGLGTGAKGSFGFGERGRQAVDQASRTAVGELMKSPQFAAIGQNDDALRAATYSSAGEAQEALTNLWGDAARATRAVRATQASVGFGRPQAIAAAQQLVTTGTGYANMQDMAQTLARASGGNTATASALAGFANSDTKQRGRFDLSPSYGTLNGLVQNEVAGNGAANDYGTALRQSWNSAGLYQLASGKVPATQQYADMYLDRLQNGNQVEKRDAAVALMEMQNMLPNATGGNQQVINNTMFRLRNEVGQRLGLDFDAGMSVEDQIAAVATHPANGTPAVDFQGRQLSGATIRGQARVYDKDTSGRPNAQNDQNVANNPPGS